MKYYVGAYASSPCNNGWDSSLESELYAALKQDSRIQGLEHPFTGQLHSEDDAWFLNNIDPSWKFVFTCVPGIMAALKKNPAFGIASNDEEGRLQAVAFMQKARDAIATLNQHSGKPVVTAIQIQTAPNQQNTAASTDALIKSLTEMQSWDWQGTRIVIEHCDTLIEGQIPAKGFLTLDQEISVLSQLNKALNTNMGLTINWGRSVIETRSTEGAVNHIQQTRDAGLLCGLMFSGASGEDTEYGAWKDSHMPHAKEDENVLGADGSLMTSTEIHKCLQAANHTELPIVGIKLGIRPASASLGERLGYIDAALTILDA